MSEELIGDEDREASLDPNERKRVRDEGEPCPIRLLFYFKKQRLKNPLTNSRDFFIFLCADS